MEMVSADNIIRSAIRKERLLLLGYWLQSLGLGWNVVATDLPDPYAQWKSPIVIGLMGVGLGLLCLTFWHRAIPDHPAIKAWSQSAGEKIYRRMAGILMLSCLVAGQLIVAALAMLSNGNFDYEEGAFAALVISMWPYFAVTLFTPRDL